jgi:hypothetical protein
LVDPSLSNQTYLGLQNQGFQNQTANIDRMGDLRARSEETIPGALVNAYQSYHAGEDRSRKQAEENQIMEQRTGQIKHQGYVNEGMPYVNEAQRIQNEQQQNTLNEQTAQNKWLGETGSDGVTNRDTGYKADLRERVLKPVGSQSAINLNEKISGRADTELGMAKDAAARARESEDLQNTIIGINSDMTLSPVQKQQKISSLTYRGGGKIPAAALAGIAAKTQTDAARAAEANRLATQTATHLSVPYQDMKAKLDPVSKSLGALEEIKTNLELYKTHTRALGQIPELEDPIANTARDNIANLADQIIPGYGAKLRERSVKQGVQSRMEDTVNDLEQALTRKFKDAKAVIDPQMANTTEVRAIEQKIKELGSGKNPNTLKIPRAAASSMAERVNTPVSGAPTRMVGGQFSPSAVGVPISNPNPVVRTK